MSANKNGARAPNRLAIPVQGNKKRKQQSLVGFVVKLSEKEAKASGNESPHRPRTTSSNSGSSSGSSSSSSKPNNNDTNDPFLDYFYPTKESYPLKDAFYALKVGSKSLNLRARFSLNVIDGKLSSLFETTSSNAAQLDDSTICWKDEVKLTNFPKYWTSSGPTTATTNHKNNHHDLQVQLITNIPSDPFFITSITSSPSSTAAIRRGKDV